MRSLWKGPYISQYIKQTFKRSLVIPPEWINKEIKVHQGKSFLLLKISKRMVGHRLGEFVRTRIYPKHKVKK